MSTSTVTPTPPSRHEDLPLPPGEWVSRPRWEDTVYAQMSTPTGKAVLMRLARHMKWRDGLPGRDGEPGNAALAAEVGVSERQVQRCLDEARRLGLIEMTRRHNNRRQEHPQAAYAARMPSVQALPMPVSAPPAPAPRPDTDVRWSASDDRTPMSGGDVDDRTWMSGGGADDRTPMSGSPHRKNLRRTSSSVGEQLATPPVAIPGGGNDHFDDGQRDDAREVIDALVRLVRGGSRTGMTVRGRVVELLAAGYAPGEITRHAEARTAVGRARGTITDPAGLLRHVLADIPPSRAAQTAEREAVREREAAARRQATAAATDTADRTTAITAALGPDLHGRIVAAAIAANPIYQRGRRSSTLARSLATSVYADHDHDIAAIRAYAETLPPAPSETATATQAAPYATDSTRPTPTPMGDGSVPSVAELEAAIAARVGAA